MSSKSISVLSILLAVAASVHQSSASAPPPEQDVESGGSTSELRSRIERYSADRSLLQRRYPLRRSPARVERMREFYRGWRESLGKIDFEASSQDGKIDHILFRNRLDYEMRSLKHQAERSLETRPLLPFESVVIELEEARQAMKTVDSRAVARRLTELSAAISATRDTVIGSKKLPVDARISPTVATRAARYTEDLARTLSRWFRFYDGYDPAFSWWVRKPYETASNALRDHAALIRRELVRGGSGDDTLIGDPIGSEALLSELAYEMIPYSPEELVDIAEREYSWCRAEMLKASRELGFGEDWKAALDHVKGLHVEPGRQPALIKELADEAVRFLDDRKLVTIPELCREGWRMQMMSPARQKTSPYFLGGESIIVSYPTESMDHADKLMSMRGNNRHFAPRHRSS